MNIVYNEDNAPNLSLGKFGEDVAEKFLKKNKYKIIGRNIRFGKHELDIVAEDNQYIIFVEVKTRSYKNVEQNDYGNPGRAVTSKKRSDTVRATYDYLKTHHSDKQPRIDVIEVFLNSETKPPQILKVNHIRNAFDSKGRILH